MANDVARLNKPTAFSGAEDEYSDWDFALTCFVGTMDGTLLEELKAAASDPRVKRTPTDEAGKERVRTLYKTLPLLTTKGPRKMVREVPVQNGYAAYTTTTTHIHTTTTHLPPYLPPPPSPSSLSSPPLPPPLPSLSTLPLSPTAHHHHHDDDDDDHHHPSLPSSWLGLLGSCGRPWLTDRLRLSTLSETLFSGQFLFLFWIQLNVDVMSSNFVFFS